MTLTPELEVRLHELCTIFLEENSKLNLSAFRTEETCWNGNILDSVAALNCPLFQQPHLRILDVGTGGGFPLIPLAICLPDSQFIGVDSTQKKIDAIQRIVDRMQIKNVELICGRTEELGHDKAHREQYDIVTARAVAELNTLLEFTSPFAKVKGHVVAWKSVTIDEELQNSLLARAEFSCHLTDKFRYTLPGDWGARQLLLFEKSFALKNRYPREVGTPKKNPII